MAKKPETVTTEEARRTLGDLITRAAVEGQPTIISRNGIPAAVLAPLSWVRERQQAGRWLASDHEPT
jgi:prevent-host-death family protein